MIIVCGANLKTKIYSFKKMENRLYIVYFVNHMISLHHSVAKHNTIVLQIIFNS
jgi:hypothetical protein